MKRTTGVLTLLLTASVATNVWLWHEANKPAEVKIERHTEWVEYKRESPEPVKARYTGETMTVTACIVKHAKNHIPDSMANKPMPDSVAIECVYGDTTATVTLPVEQRVYEDSLYTAYVSGYRPQLDSITLRVPHTIETVTRTISRPARRITFGPSVGVGYGIMGRRPDVFVGMTATLNL